MSSARKVPSGHFEYCKAEKFSVVAAIEVLCNQESSGTRHKVCSPFACERQDLTALAKELRAVEDVRPQHKATDYSSSSDDSGTTDDEDDEEVDQDIGDESTSGPEDSRGGG